MKSEKHQINSDQTTESTNVQFWNSYFEMLKYSRTRKDAFNKVNEAHFIIFGKYKHLCFEDFRNIFKSI